MRRGSARSDIPKSAIRNNTMRKQVSSGTCRLSVCGHPTAILLDAFCWDPWPIWHHAVLLCVPTSYGCACHPRGLQVFKRRGDASSVASDLDYNSLYDKHLKKHFAKKASVRNLLVKQGLITDDWRVLGTASEVFQAWKVGPPCDTRLPSYPTCCRFWQRLLLLPAYLPGFLLRRLLC